MWDNYLTFLCTHPSQQDQSNPAVLSYLSGHLKKPADQVHQTISLTSTDATTTWFQTGIKSPSRGIPTRCWIGGIVQWMGLLHDPGTHISLTRLKMIDFGRILEDNNRRVSSSLEFTTIACTERQVLRGFFFTFCFIPSSHPMDIL
jgi:hypothetical protein